MPELKIFGMLTQFGGGLKSAMFLTFPEQLTIKTARAIEPLTTKSLINQEEYLACMSFDSLASH